MKNQIRILSLISLILVAILASVMVYGSFSAKNQDMSDVENQGMPVPGLEGVEETVVNQGMPVPGIEGVEESIVTQGMPVPGFEGVEEMVVGEE